MGRLPLREYVGALAAAGYSGVYNLEPEPERWDDSVCPAEEIIRSVELLRAVLSETKEERS